MKNYEALNLISTGVLMITANDLDAANAYKVLKFKRALRNIQMSIIEGERACISEAGIENAEAFDKRRDELTKKPELTDEEKKEKNELDVKFSRFIQLREKLYNDDASLEGVKTMPYDQWHALQRENKAVQFNGNTVNILDSIAEELLEGILWVSPEE